MSPEQAAINSLDRRTRGQEIARSAERLLPIYEQVHRYMDKVRIQPESLLIPDDPNDLYTPEMIARDNKEVERLKAEFAARDRMPGPNGLTMGQVRQLSEISEFQVLRGLNAGNWMPYCRGIVPSEFDDYKNGMDMVVEFAPPNADQANHFGMGIDVSFSHDLLGKFERIKREIDNFDGEKNRLGVVKYFKSPGNRGELNGIARVVGALDLPVLEDLSRTKNDRLRGHIAGHTLVTDMERQLETFTDYAMEANPAAVPNLERARRTVSALSSHMHSAEAVENSDYQKNRDVEEAINEGLSIFK